MAIIPRKSDLKIENEDEIKSLLDQCAKFMCKTGNKTETIKEDPYGISNELIGLLHYSIGCDDHRMYLRSDDETLSKGEVQEYLAKRAYYSAMIKAFEKDISARGYNVDEMYYNGIVDENPDIPKYVYHGTTNPDIEPEKLGKLDEKTGKYYIRDGVSYFTSEKEARKFATRDKDGIPRVLRRDRDTGITDEIDLNEKMNENLEIGKAKNGDWQQMQITDAYTCFMYQDDLERYCNDGIKYLVSGTPQILDISEFTSFVKARDESILETLQRFDLKLPEGNQTLDEYIESIGMSKEKYEEIIDQKIIWPHKNEDRNIGYAEMFPSLNKEKEKPVESSTLSETLELADESSRVGSINEQIQNTKQIQRLKEQTQDMNIENQ